MPALIAHPKPRHERERLSRDGTHHEGATHHSRELLDSFGAERLPVRSRDLKDHLGLVRGHDGHVSAGDDHHSTDHCVLERGVLDRFFGHGAPHELEVGGHRQPLAVDPVRKPATEFLDESLRVIVRDRVQHRVLQPA